MSEPTQLFAPLKPAVAAPRLWISSGFIPDAWTTLADEALLPHGRAIISLKRWRDEHTTLRLRGQAIGIVVQSNEQLDVTADHIAGLAIVVLVFPKFSDGRAYSTARRLREAGYTGELRATGDILFDQIPLMLRTGFDSFSIADVATLAALDRAQHPARLPNYQRSSAA